MSLLSSTTLVNKTPTVLHHPIALILQLNYIVFGYIANENSRYSSETQQRMLGTQKHTSYLKLA